MGVMKTPGVYIVEKNAFPNSIVEVATAVPAFIGYTQKADNKGKSLHNVPFRISSMAEYANFFGGAPTPTFNITEIPPATPPAAGGTPAPSGNAAAPATPPAPVKAFSLNGKDYAVTSTQKIQQQFLLYYSMQLFFQNGGGPCYIVSVGDYTAVIDQKQLNDAIDLLEKEQEPTMVVIPDVVHLPDEASCINVQQHALMHCGDVMKSRVAILDVYNGFRDKFDPSGDPIPTFRTDIGTNHLDFGAAYYPWIETSIIGASDLGYTNLDSKELTDLLTAEAVLPADVISEVTKLDKYPADLLNKTLSIVSPVYGMVMLEIRRQLNVLPPSAAIAGIYTMVDNNQGVWKAPANVSINSCLAPTVSISNQDQETLNVDVQGKSVNAIRSFIGEGVLVWGARTLDGNSLDWRYISVRRTMIMLEQSVKLATKAYVFDPNVSTTWVTIKSMIRNFLNGIWKRGGLAGAIPDDAFAIFCGLGETMTADDILEGILRVTVLVAVTRPAEFIEITFQQQMQKS